ncbi:MAG: hypothetical protein GY822_16870 [Deltaproteobacteria bacterium]|nr:hypothetical protein [Deltaproteobacteria bacterium]
MRGQTSGGDNAVFWEWELQGPDGSSSELLVLGEQTVSFVSPLGDHVRPGFDEPGDYLLTLRAWSQDGIPSADVTAILSVEEYRGLSIMLHWPVRSDYDLHMWPLSPDNCLEDEPCFYGNCQSIHSSTYPEWDGVEGRTAGDPILERNSLSGGVDRIVVPEPLEGT